MNKKQIFLLTLLLSLFLFASATDTPQCLQKLDFPQYNLIAYSKNIPQELQIAIASQIQKNTTEEIIVDMVKFGLVGKTPYGRTRLQETEHIPNKIGTIYGWRAHLITDTKEVTWKEELILPAPAPIWGNVKKNETTISDKKDRAVTVRTVKPKNGWISNDWGVVKGDPSGKYIIRVFVENKFIKEFIFFVE